MERRNFLKIMGITSGSVVSAINLMGADKKLIPYIFPKEEEIIPGVPVYYPSTCTECPANCGLSVKVMDGKPVKLEGNAQHPINNGALCMRGQAALARLYHPKRFKAPMLKKGNEFKAVTWEEALKLVQSKLKANGGRTNVFLRSRTTGTLDSLLDAFCGETGVQRLPGYELYHHGALRKANQLLFNPPVIPDYRIQDCDFLLTLGVDVSNTFVSPVAFSSRINAARKNGMQWFHLEPHISLSGVAANKRLVIKPGSEFILAAWLLKQAKLTNPLPEELTAELPVKDAAEVLKATGLEKEALENLMTALNKAQKPLVMAGEVGTAHANGLFTALFTALLNWGLGAVNSRVVFDNPLDNSKTGGLADLEQFVGRLQAKKVGVAFISDIHDFPALPDVKGALKQAEFRVALAHMPTPVTELCDLVLPLSHTLESWGDALPVNGLRGIIQPVVHPLHDTLSEGDILLRIAGKQDTYQNYLINIWGADAAQQIKAGFKALPEAPKGDGAPITETAAFTADAAAAFLAENKPKPLITGPVVVIPPSTRTYDGRSASIDLLNEIPDPLVSISYGEWLTLSLKDADAQGLKDGDEVSFKVAGKALTLPVRVHEAVPPGVSLLSVHKADFMPYDAISSEQGNFFPLEALAKTGNVVPIPILSGSMTAKGRALFPEESAHAHQHNPEATFYPKVEFEKYHWTMVVDVDACNGCSACVAACYVENNVPVTGKKEHLKSGEMSWLRIEPYIDPSGRLAFVPMMCQHCDRAPCEPVCPVFATYRNPEGLNAQVYNRCVGTRYCSNNCPYKTRRFNWFNNEEKMPLYTESNPDVSRRPAGVMEKCSFCIQRIRNAKDNAKDHKRDVADGEMIPACAQTCPQQAIYFGNIMDENSTVYKLVNSPDAYRVLEQLGTKPSIYYIRRKG